MGYDGNAFFEPEQRGFPWGTHGQRTRPVSGNPMICWYIITHGFGKELLFEKILGKHEHAQKTSNVRLR